MVGSRITGRTFAKAFGAVGIAVGLLIQGQFMSYSVQAIFPLNDPTLTIEVLFITIATFIFAKATRVPLSLSMALVALLLGLAVSRGLPVNYAYAWKVAGMWVAAPIIAVVFGFVFQRLLHKIRVGNIWRRVRWYKFFLIACSFLASFPLGANTVGLLVAVGRFSIGTILASVVAIVVGCLFLSDGEIRRVGQDLFSMRYPNALAALVVSTTLVEFATFFAIPIASTQATSASVVGAGVSYGNKLISLRPFVITVITWTIVPTLCFGLGYML